MNNPIFDMYQREQEDIVWRLASKLDRMRQAVQLLEREGIRVDLSEPMGKAVRELLSAKHPGKYEAEQLVRRVLADHGIS